MSPVVRDARGSTSALFIFVWSVALVALGIALDVGRVFVLREQLRTAEEAAALAGVLQARFMVEARFPREENRPVPVCVPGPDGLPECRLVDNWVPIEPAVISGPEAEVWPDAHRLWADQCVRPGVRCDRRYKSGTCWIAPRSDWAAVRAAARDAFEANARWNGQARLAGPVTVEIETDASSRPRQLRVGVTAALEMDTLLLPILGVDALTVKTPGEPTTAELVRREWPGQVAWIGGVQVPSPCLMP
ncbi:MAG: Tad domain-containing protein [Symbiobacterium sp.]|uniref:pilus assembly protein TadG-related protein n=1 Tax=Symbiobacterium sp. TaxID=1971213 RepID=UPI0034644A0A